MIICWLHIVVEADIEPLFEFESEEYKLCYVYKCFSNQDQVSWNPIPRFQIQGLNLVPD